MGIKQSLDISQEVMENLLCDINDVKLYINNIGCFSSTFETHIKSLDVILTCLDQNRFTVNPSKCEWAMKEKDKLGYWLTSIGLGP